MDRLMKGESLSTADLRALQMDAGTCSCTQIYAFIPLGINWSSSNPRWW